jgi:hypothetical protein
MHYGSLYRFPKIQKSKEYPVDANRIVSGFQTSDTE